MSGGGDWLPPLITLAEQDGDWVGFDRSIYAAFRAEWVEARPSMGEKRMALKAHPLQHGREYTYYHLTSAGDDEATRQPDERRMERIRWPRAMVEAIGTGRVLMWRNRRATKSGQKHRILVALPDFSYVVVLDDRGEYVLLWTAYCVERAHQREKLRREYEATNGPRPSR